MVLSLRAESKEFDPIMAFWEKFVEKFSAAMIDWADKFAEDMKQARLKSDPKHDRKVLICGYTEEEDCVCVATEIVELKYDLDDAIMVFEEEEMNPCTQDGDLMGDEEGDSIVTEVEDSYDLLEKIEVPRPPNHPVSDQFAHNKSLHTQFPSKTAMANSDEAKNFTNLFGKQKEAEEESEAPTGEEEDTGAQVAPIVKLQEVAVATGEEDEDVLLDLKAKLYRFDKEGKQWKERGAGTVKLLKHKKTSKVRLVMRQSNTLKICANHLVVLSISVQEHAGNDKSCVWHALDYADGELKEELFCIRFASVENCKTFQNKIEEVAESQELKSGETEVANSAANLLEKLSVGESKDQEEKTKETPAEKKENKNVKQESPSRDEEEKTSPLSAEAEEDESLKPKSISDEWVCV